MEKIEEPKLEVLIECLTLMDNEQICQTQSFVMGMMAQKACTKDRKNESDRKEINR